MCSLQFHWSVLTILAIIITASLAYSVLHPRWLYRPLHDENPQFGQIELRPMRETQLHYPNIEDRSDRQNFDRPNQIRNGFNWNSNGNKIRRSPTVSPGSIFFPDDNGDFSNQNQISATVTPSTTSSGVAIPGMGTRKSPCEEACLITPQYDPVCGSDALTYSNMARLTCAQDCGKRVKLLYYASCTRVPGTPVN